MNILNIKRLRDIQNEISDIIKSIDDPINDYVNAKRFFGDDYYEFRQWAIQKGYLTIDHNPHVSDRIMTKTNCEFIYIELDSSGDRFFMVYKDIIIMYTQSKMAIND